MLEELDPWENPYQVRRIGDGVIRVLSSGPNGQSPVEGIDEDDIYSGMPVSPVEKFRHQKRVQWWIALAESGGVFLVAVAAYLSLRRLPE